LNLEVYKAVIFIVMQFSFLLLIRILNSAFGKTRSMIECCGRDNVKFSCFERPLTAPRKTGFCEEVDYIRRF